MNMRGPYIHGGYKSTFFKYSCDAMSQEIPIHADSPRFIPRRILVVEDNPLFEQVIGQVIESLGIDGKTYFCQTGSQALSLCDDNKVGLDLALVDLGLPDISGIEVIQGLRRRYPSLPIMVISVISTERSVLAAVRAGARGYILKGDSKAAITQAIQELMLGNYPTPRPWHATCSRWPAGPLERAPIQSTICRRVNSKHCNTSRRATSTKRSPVSWALPCQRSSTTFATSIANSTPTRKCRP